MSKSGFFPQYGRDWEFSSKIGRIPTKLGWLDSLSSTGNEQGQQMRILTLT